ncbi:hypothetical protein F5Y11DRAFT_345521 [Daldinia sp. FL1419]|nr:hypothetical protein F5Y11DRAFT_345521 [Daldinia sp. FL1419]
MAGASSPTSSPYAEVIKVYSTEDSNLTDWTNPRRIHMHRKTPSGVTVCCESFTAGGMVENPYNTLAFLTSDRFVPSDLELYTGTNDKSCACIGHVQHTSRWLRYALITISDALADSKEIRYAKTFGSVPTPTQRMYDAAMHPLVLLNLYRRGGLVLLARTRYNEVIRGHITILPRKAIYPSCRGPRLVIAQFERTLGDGDIGMWVYARQPGFPMLDKRTDERLAKLNCGPYPSETFRHRDNLSYPNQFHYPLPVVGHIVEIRGRDMDGQVEVAIQCAHEVFTDICVLRDQVGIPSNSNGPLTDDE